MTTTVSSDFTSIDILSDLFLDVNTISTLTVTYNCTTTYDAIDLLDEGIGTGDTYTLTPAALGLDVDKFPDGIYYFLIAQTDDSANSLTESKCVLVDQDLTCDMMDVFTDLNDSTDNIVKALAYHALKIADASCPSCSCSDWCTLYNTATSTDCEDDAPCGCS
jgi:hypothetical protein